MKLSCVITTGLVLILFCGQICCQVAPKGCINITSANEKVILQCTKAGIRKFEVPKVSDPKIESIYLNDNNLQYLNGSLCNYAPNIATVDLNRNHFKIIRNYTFKSLIHLELLYISNNQIREIESHSFSHLKKLRKLYLWGNQLEIVKDIWFRNLTALELLDLQSNRIQEFRPFNFIWPKNIETLLLQNNSFHVIPPIPQNVKVMNITENIVDCSCQREGQQKRKNEILLKVHVTCMNSASESWRKRYLDSPYCTLPTVDIAYEKMNDGKYIIKCTGHGVPPAMVSLKYEGGVTVNRNFMSQIVFGPVIEGNVTCRGKNAVGIKEVNVKWNEILMWNGTDDGQNKLTDTFFTTLPHAFCSGEEGDVRSVFQISISFIFYSVTLFVSSAFTNVALVISLYIFISYFHQLDIVYDP